MSDVPTSLDTYKKEKQNVINDSFWADDLSILFNPNRIIELVPTQSQHTNERLNALSRFLIYFGILLFIVFRDYNAFFVPIVGLFVLWIVFHNSERLHKINAEQFDQDVKKMFKLPKDMLIGIKDSGEVFQRPTPDNPFANVLISDYLNAPNRPDAGDYSDPDVRDELEKYFHYNLYQSITDAVWEKNNSQRQYYTIPSAMIPNDRDAFMNACNRATGVCKDGDQEYCLPFENLQLPGYS